MPIYEYHCRSCGSDSELIQRLSDPPARKCPICRKSTLTKIVSAAGFRLKGGGWYETDFKSGQKKNLVGTESAEAAPSAGAPADSGKPDNAAKAQTKPGGTAKSEPKSDKPAKADKGDKKGKPAKAA
jgi:putative FmdB family regulatory protein